MNPHTPEVEVSPPSFIFDPDLKKLTVRGVLEFSRRVFEYGDAIEILDMSHNQLTSLPDDLNELTQLRVAFFSGNTFHEVPPQLSLCENLEMVGLKSCGIEEFDDFVLPQNLKGLILTDNHLTALPNSIGKYEQLQKVMLTGNELTSLPASMVRLSNLELIRLAGNKLDEAPAWLADLPNLAWYADSDNEFNAVLVHETPFAAEFAWDDVVLGRKIGESSKNVVYMAELNGRKVAVKLFGSGITTDGSADDETRAALIAGDHPHIVGALGRVIDEDNREGLVMSLIPEEYKTLGFPPDMTHFTRDVYAKDSEFTRDQLRGIASSIANALEYLHSKGIMHGDVYAHNILVSRDGDAKLCDFGAASLYDRHSPSEQWREKLDVLAYGHLIEELLQRLTPGDFGADLSTIAESCVDIDASSRPMFADITMKLQNL